MIPVTPVVIPEPFAENGAKNTIPDQSPGGTEPNASWNTGFPPITMINRKAGGKPPLGADFNGILNALSQHAFFTQSGCIFPWRGSEDDFPGLNYLVGAHVLGADMKEYIAVQPSGPDIPASGGGYVGPRDPTTDSDRTWWRPAVTGGDLPEFDGTTIKLINGKYGVPEFTAPTASAPGTAGLVPGPEATPENELLLNLLSAKGFMKIDPAILHPTAQSVELNKTTLDMGGVSAEGVNIDTLLRTGIFSANIFAGTLPDGVTGGVLINIMSQDDNGLYYPQQIFYSYANKLYFRTNSAGNAPGGVPAWLPWAQLGGPMPYVQASLHADLTCAAQTETVVPFTADAGDTGNFANGVYTCPRAGLIFAMSLVRAYGMGASVGGSSFNLRRDRGAEKGNQAEYNPNYTQTAEVTFKPSPIFALLPVLAGDKIYLSAYFQSQAQLATANLTSSVDGTHYINTFSLAYLQ